MKKKRYIRDESLYNKIQEREFLNFFEFVRHLTNYVCKGRKMKMMIQCLLIIHKFPDFSLRRARGFLLLLKKFGIIFVDIPCFKTLSNYRENNSLQIILDKLIEESSKPLSVIEHDFATDATGIRTKLFSSWYSIRCQKEIKRRDHLTIHITTGIKSNVVTALNVEIKSGNDNKIMREHVDKTNENFKIDEWSGDGRYWCKENCKKVFEVGAKPYFKVWKNWSGKSRGCMIWKIMNLESKNNTEEYGKHYHKRSNVESTNHSKKALFGDKIYSRLPSARINEETLRWINYNINVLNRARYEWKINPKFMV
jgi:YHS domain-containing protein